MRYAADMKFFGRSEELIALQEWWKRPRPFPALVWGRRRVGKTALLQRFARDLGVRVIFHTGTGEPTTIELADLSRQAAAVLGDVERNLAAQPYESWRDALEHLATCGADVPILLVLDEFPELLTAARSLPGVLRAFLDRDANRAKLRFLLSGSAVRTVNAMREYRAPLYGRFDLSLLLHPFRPHEAAAMLSTLPPAQRALVYGIVGGTPLYLSWWDQHSTIAENLKQLACRPAAAMLTEGQLILATEAGAGDHTAAVLSAIAAGKTRHNEIRDVIDADPTRTLERLVELRMLDRQVPVTEDIRRDRRRIYQIADPFLAFYLGPLMRYRAEIERGLGDSIVSSLIGRLDNHMGLVYEEAFRDYLRRQANAGQLGEAIVAIGPWWRADGHDQIDAVVLAEPELTRVPVMVGESKWTQRVNGARVAAQLAQKARNFVDDVDALHYIVCARDQVTHADELRAVTATDIFTA